MGESLELQLGGGKWKIRSYSSSVVQQSVFSISESCCIHQLSES